jgi:CheY-like chemotaxis protein
MAKREKRVAPRAWRPVRIAIEGVRGRIGNVDCSLSNVSTTGAMVRSKVDLSIGREVPLVLEVASTSVTVQVRVARCEPVDVALPGAVWRQQENALGVVFVDPSAELRRAVRRLMKEVSGIEHTAPRVLVLGEDDAIGKLINRTLSEADYVPRLLIDPRYAVGTAKRLGARAVLVNLRIDPEFSARSILDALRADPVTAQMPVIVCARQAWLQPAHQTYLSGKRLRLLLVPFTPEELVMTLDRAISEGC